MVHPGEGSGQRLVPASDPALAPQAALLDDVHSRLQMGVQNIAHGGVSGLVYVEVLRFFATRLVLWIWPQEH